MTDCVLCIIYEHCLMCFNTRRIYHKYLLTYWKYTSFPFTVDELYKSALILLHICLGKKRVTVKFYGLCTIVMSWRWICSNAGISIATHLTGIFIVPISLTYLSFLRLNSRAIMWLYFMTVYFLLKEVKNYIKALWAEREPCVFSQLFNTNASFSL